jgi:hypothetical protein
LLNFPAVNKGCLAAITAPADQELGFNMRIFCKQSKAASRSTLQADLSFARNFRTGSSILRPAIDSTRRHFNHLTIGAKAIAFIPLLLLPMAAFAQSGGQGSIDGTVKDSSGAVVSSATVKVTNEATGATRTAQTDSRGFFAVESLEPGSYTVTVTAQGFSTTVTKGETLAPGQQRESDTSLTVGTAAQQVTVQADAVQVETESSANESTITAKEVTNLMLNGRNFQGLGQLAPGVTSTQSGNSLPGGGLGGGTNLIVNGNSVEYTVYTIDGVEDENTGNLSNLNVLPIVDAIQQFSVLSDNYSAKYGWSGSGQIVVQTKSGTSSYHGQVWDYLRNDAFDANNYFDITKASLHQNIYGYTFGGPVPKASKTFFFASNEWRSASIGQTATGAVLTPAELSGDLSKSQTLPGPSPSNPKGGLLLDSNSQALLASEGLTNCIVPGNNGGPSTAINPACINKVSSTLYHNYVPNPNNPGGGFNNYINQNPEKLTQLDYTYRIDHSFSENETLTGRAMYEEVNQQYPYDNWFGSPYSTTTDSFYTTGSNLLLRLNSVITPKLDNIATLAYSDDKPRIANTSGNTQLPAGLAITQAFPGADPLNRIPTITFSKGYSSVGVGTQPIHASDGEGIISDDVSYVKGSHVLQAGAVYVFGIKRQNVFTTPQGSFSFSGTHTDGTDGNGDPVADFLLGLDTTYSQNSNQKSGSYHYRQGEAYFQDDWKPTPKLTLNLGLRWFYFSPDTVSGDEVTNFNPATYSAAAAPVVTTGGSLKTIANVPVNAAGGTANLLNGLVFAGKNGTTSGFFTANKKAFAPRVGFAYALGDDGKTSVRGGYGIGYTREAVEQIYGMFGTNPPYNASATVLNSLINNGIAGSAGASPQSLDAISTSSVGPSQTQSYSLSFQRQVLPAAIATVAYAGSVSRHLETQAYNQNENLPVSAPTVNNTKCFASGQAPSASYDFDPCINGSVVSPYVTVPYLGYTSITTQAFPGSSNYNSLQGHIVYRSNALQIDTAYTYSKVLTDLGGSQGAGGGGSIGVGAQDWRNLGREYGTPDWDRKHVFTTSIVYDLPFFKASNELLKQSLGGWSFAGLTVLESGFALSPGLSTSTNGDATRPNAIGPERKIGKFGEWFNTANYQQAPYGFYGNASNGSIRGPAEFTGNTALYKTFPIKEKLDVQFRAEAFNVANHPNYSAVSTGYGSGNFGAVTSALDPRILEFALRVNF